MIRVFAKDDFVVIFGFVAAVKIFSVDILHSPVLGFSCGTLVFPLLFFCMLLMLVFYLLRDWVFKIALPTARMDTTSYKSLHFHLENHTIELQNY